MSKQALIKIILLSLIVPTLTTSCGLFNNDSENMEVKDSTTENTSTETSNNPDNLFVDTNDTTNKDAVKTDTPSNLAQDLDLKSLDDDFKDTSLPKPTEEKVENIAQSTPKLEKIEEKPQTQNTIKIEEAPVVNIDEQKESDEGKILNYKTKKGETLMQIAFKIYGDISKWKSIKALNKNVGELRNEVILKYKAPAKKFTWNPQGTPHLIKTGETLGSISKDVYDTSSKWRMIFENNRPLIKNPNVIYAGFTLYYKKSTVGLNENISQKLNSDFAENSSTEIEDIKINEAISKIEKNEKIKDEEIIDLTSEVQSSITKESNDENLLKQ